MAGIGAGLVALLVTLSTLLYLGITVVLAWKLAVEGPEVRRVLALPLLPMFFENIGIPLALTGFALRETNLIGVGGLLLVVSALICSRDSVSLHPAIEAPLLRLAAVALSAVGLFHALA